MSEHTERVKAEPYRIGKLYENELQLYIRSRKLFENRQEANEWYNMAVQGLRDRQIERGELLIHEGE